MEITTTYTDKTDAIMAMFTESFAQSEGPDEGRLIGSLVADMLRSVPPGEIYVFSAMEIGSVQGAIIFTRITYPEDARAVFILSPVAVAPPQQGKGLGQRLIRHGLDVLRGDGVDIALTYGDINFYQKVGFRQITETEAKAPQPLQYPHGWLGQSLTGARFEPLAGPSRCVQPLNTPDLW